MCMCMNLHGIDLVPYKEQILESACFEFDNFINYIYVYSCIRFIPFLK